MMTSPENRTHQKRCKLPRRIGGHHIHQRQKRQMYALSDHRDPGICLGLCTVNPTGDQVIEISDGATEQKKQTAA